MNNLPAAWLARGWLSNYGDMLPEELLSLTEDEIRSSVPMMYSGAARSAVSELGQLATLMQLNTLMYQGFADLDGAIRAFQADLDEPVTGELTVGQIHELGYRAERTRLGFVSFFAIAENFAQVAGTAEIVGDEIAEFLTGHAQTARWVDKKVDQRQVKINFPIKNRYLFDIHGAPTRTRTADPLITNQLLYQLSYRGTIWVE